MEFDQLRYFLALSTRENFTRTAAELGISQPALSRSIQKLEEELGQPLFDRRARAVTLTDAGQLLQSRARQVLTLVDETKAEISDDGRSGRIRIGAIPTIAPYFLPELLGRFAEEFPGASVIVREQTTDLLLKAITQGEVDLAVVALPFPAKYIEIEELFAEELFLVLPPGHDLIQKTSIRLTDIEPLPFVLLDEAHCLSDNIVSFCRNRNFHPVSVERTSQLAMVQELVALSHGISMIPAMARDVDGSGRRVYRSLSGKKPTRTIAAVWNPYRFQSRLLEAFKDRLRVYAAEKATRHGDG
ncbi:LysR family transcriptional regulator [Stratiformator vulcanicus]|uniref:Hydrogen peroxide-inducible genes activator n=1 Tax=Stratiformator vulcanicus TaxID=2527980 RepID=A0A517R4Q6_9PLAN|nr:LysR family transcriptional regulator [Stratiformator vulcanicus]QDT38803.1 Hydrogen peroxide-inducible genes activator [Stratiformator vulcanicus]